MKAKAMLKALKNMREDAIICFGAGHKPNWVRGFAQFSQDDKTLYLMNEAPGVQGMKITVEILRDVLEQGRNDAVVKTFDNLEVLFMTFMQQAILYTLKQRQILTCHPSSKKSGTMLLPKD